MTSVAEQKYNDELKLLRDAHKTALNSFFKASNKSDELIALKAVTLVYSALKRKEAEQLSKVNIKKHVVRVVEKRSEQRLNYNE